MATKTHPFKLKISYSSNDTTYTDLTDIRKIKPPKISEGKCDTTWLQSTQAFEESIPGWKKAGQFVFQAFFTKAQLNTLFGTIFSNIYYWKVFYPLLSAAPDNESNNSVWKAQAWISDMDMEEGETNNEKALMYTVTMEITGVPTFTPGT